MDIWAIVGLLIVGYAFYYILFKAPPSDMVFRSRSETEVVRLKSVLESNGIKTYIKHKDMRRFHSPGGALTEFADPSLHVLHPGQRKDALRLIAQLSKRRAAS